MKKSKELSIIIPSYNEAENIRILLKDIYKRFPDCFVYIVDDSNKTENKKIRKYVLKYENVTLISRFSKSGRGSAVIVGFKEALKRSRAMHFMEMDSDLAHDPSEIEKFIEKMTKEDLGMVIGSRYVPGGKILHFTKNRKLISNATNRFLKRWLGIHVSDFTSGFRLYSRKCMEYLVSQKIRSKGFITLSETLFKISKGGFAIGEVPITVHDRVYGTSSVNTKELFISLYYVLIFRIEHIFVSFKWKKLFIAFIIFLLAFVLRMSTLNQMGKTWDEPEYMTQGYIMDNLLLKKDFGNSYFYTTYDHPPLVKYIYGITAHLDSNDQNKNGGPIFDNDYTYSRTLSAVMGSMSAVLIFLIAFEFASIFVAFLSGVIFLTLPHFVGLSQLVTTESFLMFFFTLATYIFIKLLNSFSYKKAIILGIVTGISILIKQSNGLLFPLFGAIYSIWFIKNRQVAGKSISKYIKAILIIIIFCVITFVILWPMPYAHLDVISQINQKIWLVKTAPPEVFWRKLILSPVIYFVTMFLITTPLLIIVLFLFGLKEIDNRKKWILYSLIIWFLLPFVQSFYPWRQHAVRYIIEIYAPLSIIAALGAEKIALYFKKHIDSAKTIIAVLVVIYCAFVLYAIKPYFLDYYNEAVGGTKNVYDKKYFEIGWWGDGMKEAGLYLSGNARNNSTVGLAVSPITSFPSLSNLRESIYQSNKKYDYVVVNYYHVLREGFDDSGIKSAYKLIYQVKAGGAPIVDIYSRKN